MAPWPWESRNPQRPVSMRSTSSALHLGHGGSLQKADATQAGVRWPTPCHAGCIQRTGMDDGIDGFSGDMNMELKLWQLWIILVITIP